MDIRNVVVSFRLTEEEAFHLDLAGEALNHQRSRGDFARASSLHLAGLKVPKPAPFPKAERIKRKPSADVEALTKVLGQLGKIGSNLNQLAKVANSNGEIPAEATFLELAELLSLTCKDVTASLQGKAIPADEPRE